MNELNTFNQVLFRLFNLFKICIYYEVSEHQSLKHITVTGLVNTQNEQRKIYSGEGKMKHPSMHL